jgi:hypothetical protein
MKKYKDCYLSDYLDFQNKCLNDLLHINGFNLNNYKKINEDKKIIRWFNLHKSCYQIRKEVNGRLQGPFIHFW